MSKFFTLGWNFMAKEVHEYAIGKGWWDAEVKLGIRRNDAELIALMHSELSEALEALRHGNPPDDKVPEFNGMEAELADVVIRIMDMAATRGYRVAEAIIAKHKYNLTREHMHGGKKF